MSDIEGLLADTGPLGVFLRFVYRLTRRDDLFTVRGRTLVASGMPAGVFVARPHWILGPDPDDARSLLAETLAGRNTGAVYWGAPGSPGPLPEGWTAGVDQLFVGRPAPGDVGSLLSGDAFLAALDRLDPELADRVAPPPIRARLPFVLHGLAHEGRIVALCDTTVDDGDQVAIQQVHTVERLRGRGLATALVRHVLAYAGNHGRGVIWMCDRTNLPSASLARRVGLSLHAEPPLMFRGFATG